MPAPNRIVAHCRRADGLTLIELLITITIIGILASVAIPSLSSFMAQQRIKSASFDFMSMVTLARSEAIKRNTSVDVTPTGGNWKNGWSVSVAGTVLSQQAAYPGLTVVCKAGTTVVTPCPTLTYNNNGRISGASPQSVEISNSVAGSGSTRCINTDLSGRPNSKKSSCP